MNISIMGCGWLGLPLAERLLAEGFRVQGSTTRKEKLETLKRSGVTPFLIHSGDPLITVETEPFWKCELLILNIPPGRSRAGVRTRHPLEIEAIRKAAESGRVDRVLFVSSTSVYGASDGVKREMDAGTEPASSESGEALLEAERILMDSPRFETTVLRLGGLYGYDRHPARNLSGRSGLTGGSRPVNLIHRDDAVEILARLVRRADSGECYNGVSDFHPTRKELYSAIAKRMGLAEPAFKEESSGSSGKMVSNEKLKRALGYTFIYPDPAEDAP